MEMLKDGGEILDQGRFNKQQELVRYHLFEDEEEFHRNISNKVIFLRKLNNLTQKELALLLGCSESKVNMVERNKRKLGLYDYFRLVGLLGFSKCNETAKAEAGKE